MPSRREWASAFAKQAMADFDTWNALQFHGKMPTGLHPIAKSQKLHFLQMACEKLAKAYLLMGGAQLEDLEKSHKFIAIQLPIVIQKQMLLNVDNRQVAYRVRRQCARIAREIELLSPAVKGGGKRLDNCEYPWESNKRVFVPAEWPFSNLNLLSEVAARNILKRIREAAKRLANK